VLDDYDFEVPTGNLEAKFTRLKQHSHAQAEHYDYPGNYLKSKTGETYANIRLDELQIEHELIQGRGNALGLQTGALFTLNNHYIDTENSDHVVTYTDFTINSNLYGGSTEESHYDCRFTAIRATQQFRPGRITPVPFVHGLQSATVVGKSGEEIWTDKYGRIKVQFHWDRYGKDDEKSSCWIRVAYPVAGKNWGWISLPRIGQEVVVSFLEGNPDRPLITGSVYNALQMPPYELPANQTQSGIKTRSSKDGVATNFNEIRFEDKKASEEVYIHAEKDFNCVIENNETRKIGLDKKDEGNQTVEIQNHRTVSLLAGNDTLTVKQGNRVTSVDTGNNTLQVKTGNCETNVDTGNNSLNVKTGNCNTHISTGNYVIDVDVGKVAITATTAIELTVGGNSIKIDQKGITIKGLTVTVQADVKLDAKSPLTTVNGDGTLTLKGGMTMIN
jgi:type VI secretion system secreted protein VgrG